MKKPNLKEDLAKALAPTKPKSELISLIEEHKSLYSDKITTKALDNLIANIKEVFNV